MKKSLFMVLVVIGLSGVMVLGSISGTVPPPIQTVYSSSALETNDDEDQQDEPTDDESADEPEPLDENGGLIEKEKECPKGEYDNDGKCTKIPQCTPPETWSGIEEKCRIFPWWQVMR